MRSSVITALIFDFDGTLLDTETPVFEAWSEAYRRRDAHLDVEIWREGIGSHGKFDPCVHLAELTGKAVDPEEIRPEVRRRTRELCSARPMPGAAERIREAVDMGLALGIASSSSSGWVEGWLEELGLAGSFRCVCGRDHVDRVKPAPDLFLLAARRLGVEPSGCLVFEDSPNGVRAATRAGMRCVAVPNDMTRHAAFPPADLVLTSLEQMSLGSVLEQTAVNKKWSRMTTPT